MSDVLEKTTINATARIQKDNDGKFNYEVVVGFLPIDDVVRFDSKKYNNIISCVSDMIISFPKDVAKLIKEYEP